MSYLHTNSSKPHFILLDLKMPRVNGFEFLEWLKSQPFDRDMYVVGLSASDDPNDQERTRKSGARAYLMNTADARVRGPLGIGLATDAWK